MPRIEPVPIDDVAPELRQRYDAGVAEGRYTMTMPLQIFAYAQRHAEAVDENYRMTFRQGLLDSRLQELLRIRSAQLNGCAPCSSSRKDESISAEDAACMIEGVDDADFTDRERRALTFLYKFNTDHHAIGDADFLHLAEVFTTAEIVELGQICAQFAGGHRWLHVLDVFSEDEPLLRYAPGEVNATRTDSGQTGSGQTDSGLTDAAAG